MLAENVNSSTIQTKNLDLFLVDARFYNLLVSYLPILIDSQGKHEEI